MTMRYAAGLAAAAMCFAVSAADAAQLSGAGGTAIYPVLSKWADAYAKTNGDSLNYQAIGSGGGIKQIEAKTVPFANTDKPLTPDELTKNDLIQFPQVIISIVPVLHVEGIKAGELVLDGPTLADIYLGKVKTWNDAEIQKINPKVKLPAQAISVVHRSDGSGTTFNFTDYLSKVSPDW
ncbi:MAG TPA: phosphate ABC transporter substrate-binding protein PstS, partial [Magnetospirillaceae bacterium]